MISMSIYLELGLIGAGLTFSGWSIRIDGDYVGTLHASRGRYVCVAIDWNRVRACREQFELRNVVEFALIVASWALPRCLALEGSQVADWPIVHPRLHRRLR